MTQSIVQSAAASAAGPDVAVKLKITPTVGNLLVGAKFVRNSYDAGLLGFNSCNTALFGPGNDTRVGLSYRVVQPGDGTIVSTHASGSTETDLIVIEIAGCETDIANVFDTGASNTSGTATVRSLSSTTSLMTSDANEIALAFCGQRHGNGGNVAWTNSFIAIPDVTSYLMLAYKILSGTQTVETTASWSEARPAGITLAMFEAAPPAPADPFPAGYQPPPSSLRM